MRTTRSAARKGESPNKDEGSEATAQVKSNTRSKRTLSAPSAPTSQAKRGKVDDDGKSQKTIEETLSKGEDEGNDKPDKGEPERGEGEGEKDAKDREEKQESQQEPDQDTEMKDQGAGGDEVCKVPAGCQWMTNWSRPVRGQGSRRGNKGCA